MLIKSVTVASPANNGICPFRGGHVPRDKQARACAWGLVWLITPTTPTVKRYFFLLVDVVSCYMWFMLLSTKDEAMMVFKVFQARAEAEA
jgi:hypothetical protein